MTQSYKQKLNDLIYILGEKQLNAVERQDFEMVYAAGAAKSYVESAVVKLESHITITVTSGTQYYNLGRGR
jgi:hypothetical protein